MSTIKKWIDARKAERTSWDGAIHCTWTNGVIPSPCKNCGGYCDSIRHLDNI